MIPLNETPIFRDLLREFKERKSLPLGQIYVRTW